MTKSLLNQVLLDNDFVLEPSNEIKNQRLVSYLNLIYNLIVETRNSNYLGIVLSFDSYNTSGGKSAFCSIQKERHYMEGECTSQLVN